MSTYLDEVKTEKKFKGNVVIQITPKIDGADSSFFAIHSPDSGLNVQTPHNRSVISLNLNPTQIDLRKVTTTIANYSFRILDKDEIITSLVGGDAADLIGAEVRIFLGRVGVAMAFEDYFELPVTYITKCEHPDNTYSFSSSEQTERMDKPLYDFKSALGVDILSGTTIWTMRDDISSFPTTGFLKVDNEFVSYTGKDLVLNRFTGVVRGELNSIPVAHNKDSDVVLVETVTDNPLNIILKLLTSNGGGGTYDVLQDGLGIDEDLIDVADIEALRDELFSDIGDFKLSFYEIDSALKTMENEILMPLGLRFTNSLNSKVTLAVLDKARFVDELDVINEDTITKYPKWTIDGTKITNIIEARWDFEEGTGVWQQRAIFRDEESIALYGPQRPLKFDFKGPKALLDGEATVNDFGSRLLARLSVPTPEIEVTTQIDKSLQTIGDKAYLVSSKIPAPDGSLEFASDLEIVSRAINQTNGDVKFKLAFTSFTTIRSGFIAPSDLITSMSSQKKLNVAVGRSSRYMVGWYMRLWDQENQIYTDDPPNKIVGFETGSAHLVTQDGDQLVDQDGNPFIIEGDATEDSIVFQDDWTTVISDANKYRLRFADYDEAVASQKRYCFLSDSGLDFADGKPTYKVTY